MAAPYRPNSVKQFQAENWYWTPTIAVITAPTVAELTGGSVIQLTGYVFGDIARPTRATNLVSRSRRLADAAQYQQVGTGTYTGGALNYALNPQAASGDADRKVWDAFVDGAQGFFVQRVGIDVDTAIVATQQVSVFPVDVDEGVLMPEGQDDAAESAATNTYTVTGPPARLVAVVA